MNAEEFAKYVINNMNRATIGNAMNISNRIDTQDGYSFEEFYKNCNDYVLSILKDNKLSPDKCYKLLAVLSYSYKKYSTTNANKLYVIDDLIISMWRIMNGY